MEEVWLHLIFVVHVLLYDIMYCLFAINGM
jgi:hypothetical protein